MEFSYHMGSHSVTDYILLQIFAEKIVSRKQRNTLGKTTHDFFSQYKFVYPKTYGYNELPTS